MGLLYDSGMHVLVPAPAREIDLTRLMLGERNDRRGDTGLDQLNEVVGAPQALFTYGQPYGSWEGALSFPDQHRQAIISDEHLSIFMNAAYWLVPPTEDPRRHDIWVRRGIDAIASMQQAIKSPEAAEVVVFKAPFGEWARDGQNLPMFVGWIQQLLHAFDYDIQDRWHVIRDDLNDEGADPADTHPTIIRMGHGPVPLFVIEESVVEQGDDGQAVLYRQVSVTKSYTEAGAVGILNRFRLAERLRLERKLQEAEATEDETRDFLNYADRSTVQRDRDVQAWLDWRRNPPPPGRMEQLRQVAATVLNRVVDSSFLRWVDSRVHNTSGRHRL